MERDNPTDVRPAAAPSGEDRADAPSTSAPGPGLRQFIRFNVSPESGPVASTSETASSPTPATAPALQRPAPVPFSQRRAPASGLIPLGLLLADATILGLAFALLKASPVPSTGRLILCGLAVAVACVAGCLAVITATEES